MSSFISVIRMYGPTANNAIRKRLFCLVLGIAVMTTPVFAQGDTGFVFPNRLGISYQKNIGVDIGLISFNQWNDHAFASTVFYDVSLGVESFVTNPFVLAPKLSFDIGIGDVLSVGGGLEVSRPTDFSRSMWVLTPKIGMSMSSVIRLYYGRHIFQQKDGFPGWSKNRVSLEMNLAAFHSFKIGL